VQAGKFSAVNAATPVEEFRLLMPNTNCGADSEGAAFWPIKKERNGERTN
jgi:hypothetical protein